MAEQNVDYSKIFPADYSVTGIRSESEDNTQVVMTGSCPPLNQTLGMIYRGPMNPIDSLGYHCLTPKIGETIISSVFYGPDTFFFNPKIGIENVRVVGTYKYEGDPLGTVDHGVLYEGPPDGTGKNNWTRIDMPNIVAEGIVRSTLPHSTMGDLIVGNYDLLGLEGKFNAFIYNITTDDYTQLTLEPYKLVTAYGIWQNGRDDKNKNSYTIAGGLDDGSGINVGYLVDYNSDTLSNLRTFVSDKDRNLITHFEGITDFGEGTTQFGPRYYSLAATVDQDIENGGAAFAVVERLSDGSFSDAEWQPFEAGSSATTGNTVLTNNLFGIYSTSNKSTKSFQSYVASNFPLADVKAEE